MKQGGLTGAGSADHRHKFAFLHREVHAIQGAGNAVSYTHLDVYKRQEIARDLYKLFHLMVLKQKLFWIVLTAVLFPAIHSVKLLSLIHIWKKILKLWE